MRPEPWWVEVAALWGKGPALMRRAPRLAPTLLLARPFFELWRQRDAGRLRAFSRGVPATLDGRPAGPGRRGGGTSGEVSAPRRR